MVLRDFVDGELFHRPGLGDPRDLRLLLYYDDTNVVHFDSVESCGALRAIPANYPHYVRENPRLWWTLAVIPTLVLRSHSISYFVGKVLTELQGRLDKRETVWDAFRKQDFEMRVAVVGVLGDLLGRNLLFHFPQSFSKLWRWCPLCMATRDDKGSSDSELRTTEDTKFKGKLLDSLSDPQLKRYLSKDWGILGYSVLFDFGVPLEASLDDVMHTVLMGSLVRQWTIAFTAFYFTDEMRDLANQRCDVYPFTKRQEALSGLATKLPKKARNKLTALAPLLLISRQLFRPTTRCECIVEELDPLIIGTHGLSRHHSVVDHFVCLRTFIHAVLFTIRREFPSDELETVRDMWSEWKDLMVDLQYEQWFHVKEHLLVNHTVHTLQRGGPLPFFWSFANERAHVDIKRTNTNNKDDSYQRLKRVQLLFLSELEATNIPDCGGMDLKRKGKPNPRPELEDSLRACYQILDPALLPVRNNLFQEITLLKYRGVTITPCCFVKFHSSFTRFYNRHPYQSVVARIAAILEHTTQRCVFVLARLYLLSGDSDDALDCTGFPFVTLLPDPEVLIPAVCVSVEVNVVPVDLDFFVERNRTVGVRARASWSDWENGSYQGKLVVVPT